VEAGNIRPHDVAILVRQNRHAEELEEQIAPALFDRGVRLRTRRAI
jgi:superfamily I DNA/RNA helicase